MTENCKVNDCHKRELVAALEEIAAMDPKEADMFHIWVLPGSLAFGLRNPVTPAHTQAPGGGRPVYEAAPASVKASLGFTLRRNFEHFRRLYAEHNDA